jgi:FkbM family methyltransferase
MIQYLPSILDQLNLTVKGCIHIGAHWGQEYPVYKHLGIENLLFYEPLEHNFKRLKESVGEEVTLRNVALGNTCGTVEMFVEEANQSMSCSVLEPKHHLEQYPHITFPKKQEVEITKLDLEDFDRDSYNFINIDVQGYELEVFKGASNTLESVNLIFSEINKEEMYKDCVRVDQLDSYLNDFGFKRVATDWEGGTWGNGVYFKE